MPTNLVEPASMDKKLVDECFRLNKKLRDTEKELNVLKQLMTSDGSVKNAVFESPHMVENKGLLKKVSSLRKELKEASSTDQHGSSPYPNPAVENLTSELAHAKKQVDEITTKLARATADSEGKSKKIESMAEEVQQSKRKAEDQSKIIESLESKMSSLLQTLASQKAFVNGIGERLQTMEHVAGQKSEKKAKENEAELLKQAEKIRTLQNALDSERRKMTNLERILVQGAKDREATLNEEIRIRDDKLHVVDGKVNKLIEELELNQGEVAELRKRSSKQCKQLSSMIEKTEELTYENESLQKSLKEAKNEISIMSSQLTSTSASIVEQEEMVKDAIEKIGKWQKDMAGLKDDMATLVSRPATPRNF